MQSGDSAGAGPRPAVLGIVLATGAVLRLREYLFNRSLWTDEAGLSLNIVELGYRGLFGRLEHDQGAPPGFLVVEKAVSEVLGSGELALRLVPLLCGVAAVWLVYAAGRRLVGERSALLAAGLLAVMEPAIRYSVEVKQYSTDVAITLLLLGLAGVLVDESEDARRYVALALAGAAAIWLSHAAMMVTAGVGIVLMARAVHSRSAGAMRGLVMTAVVWMLSFAGLYTLSLSHLIANDYLHDFWIGAYAPLPPTSPADLRWYHTALLSLLQNAVGPYGGGLGLFAALVGTVALLAVQATRWKWALTVSPIVVCLILSGFELYPFSDRMVLFLLPLVLLLSARGVVALWDRSRAAGACAAVAMLVTPVVFAAADFRSPSAREELRPVLEAVHQALVPSDGLLIYYGAMNAFRYYSRHGGIGRFPEIGVIEAHREDWSGYEREVAELGTPGRSWVVFSHVYSDSGANEEEVILFFLDRAGTRLGHVSANGASAYLYEFPG